jgi:hypothetical protein
MQCDISLAVEQIQAPEALKAAVVKLFHTHAGKGSARRGAAAAAATAGEGGEDSEDATTARR